MNPLDFTRQLDGLTRRQFVQGAAATAAAFAIPAWAQEAAQPAENAPELAVAIIGVGSQGGNLLNNCLKIPGIRFVAVCDIWPYWLERYKKLLKRYDMDVNTYVDYQDMLAKEKNIDAVIVATPDWVHAEQTNACLKAGKHVYCEKEMSNTLEGAASMVKAARETGKLLQIGHQRRSNPRYWHALKLIGKDKILGRITHFYGQWNRVELLKRDWPQKYELDADTLSRYGYGNMRELRNWRWYRKYSGGPICDLGSHQIDVFNWVLQTQPKAVLASGGVDYYGKPATIEPGQEDYYESEWYDNIMSIYEYQIPEGTVRGFYQVLNTTSNGGFYETFMGDQGTLTISEDKRKGYFFRELKADKKDWEEESETKTVDGQETFELKIGETLTPDGSKDPESQKLLDETKKPEHQLHLENFFNAVRTGTPLSCPPEIGYETAVSVMKVNDAVAAGKKLEFSPSEFKV